MVGCLINKASVDRKEIKIACQKVVLMFFQGQ